MLERRLTIRMAKYWDELRKEKPLPNYTQFNVSALDDLAPFVLVMKIIPQPKLIMYQYEYIGKAIIESYGKDLTGEMVNIHMHNFPGARILRRIEEISSTPRLIIDDGQFITHKQNIIRYRASLLPFGNDKGGITHIVAGMSWREY